MSQLDELRQENLPPSKGTLDELSELAKQAELVVDEADKIALATKAFQLINQLLDSQ
jgi:hypothetical protein